MNFGGPVWHASAMAATPEGAEGLARTTLNGVGESLRGEWVERATAFHIRRRLSEAEQAVIGDARDIRGTEQEYRRMAALLRDAPHLRLLL